MQADMYAGLDYKNVADSYSLTVYSLLFVQCVKKEGQQFSINFCSTSGTAIEKITLFVDTFTNTTMSAAMGDLLATEVIDRVYSISHDEEKTVHASDGLRKHCDSTELTRGNMA